MRVRRATGVLVTALGTWCATASAAGPNATLLLSRPSGLGALPVPGDGESFVRQKAISGDGSRIVFISGADDLGVRDTGLHVWVRNTVAGTTTLVDRVPGGGMTPGNGSGFTSVASISRDGGTVCFVDDPTNLVAGVSGDHVFVVTLSSGAIAVADRAAGPSGEVGDDRPSSCALDAVGKRVVFDSFARNLVAGETNGRTDVFVRDLDASSTTRVSVDSAGAQAPGGGRGGVISADGAKVAFSTASPLISGDTNDFDDVYVRNLQANTLVRASLGTGSVPANGPSSDPSIDDSGGHVAFTSFASNLELGGDTNDRGDVFWRDLTGSDTTILVSRATGVGGALGDENSFSPAISGDGLGVAFQSFATNLGAGTPPGDGTWVYLRRLVAHETLLLSRASGATGAPANASSAIVSLATAPTVATWLTIFQGSNLDPDASGEFSEVYKRDLSGEPETILVSRPTGTAPRNAGVNNSFLAGPGAMSADGRFVVFESGADGIDPVAASRIEQVFVRDTLLNTTTLVSRGPGPAGALGNGGSSTAAVSADGTHVVFVSAATNLLPGVTDLQVYVRDLATGELQVASRADGPDGAVSTALQGFRPAISADGRRVAFTAFDRLAPADTNLQSDVYVRDLGAGTTTLASATAGGTASDGGSFGSSLSNDGMRVAFTSFATNLLGGAPISGNHVYVRDLGAGTIVLADRRASDGAPGQGDASSPTLSGNGNRVVFETTDPLTSDPIPPGALFAMPLYVRDLTTNTTMLAARADGPDGTAVTTDSAAALDDDGTRVFFTALGPELPGAPDVPQLYVRDLAAATTTLVSAADGTATTLANARAIVAAVSADGGCAAFNSAADNLTTPAYPTRDFRQIYLRVVAGECPVGGSTTTPPSPTPSPGTPIRAKTLVLRPGKLAKLVANGGFALPAGAADPTAAGGTLAVSGTTGSVRYALPTSGWKSVGRRKPKGFKFKGPACRVTFLRRRIKAVCRGDTGGLRLPEPGPVELVLTLGAETAAYCAECGGTAAGNPARVFKRRGCGAPATCP